MAQPNLNDQKNTQLTKHRSEHVAYWKGHNKPTDEKKFTDGFNAGWSDAENASIANRDAMVNQRKNENAAQCGNSSFDWVFETGYREGFDTRRRCGQADTHDQKMAEMAKHKDAHLAYWKAHGNRQTDPRIFEDGFINGWCDCEQNLANSNITVNSMMGQRHQEHVRTFGNSPCEWAFDDGYREGFEGRKCMKPQQPAAPAQPAPATTPAPSQQPNMNDQKNTQLTRHRSEHVAYWRAHNKPTDEKKFTDGFNVGWSDAENASIVNRDAMVNQRKNENNAQCGNSSFDWVFETGYREGFDARRRCNPGGQADTHDQKMAEMTKHKDAHIAYWRAHGNRQTDPRIFEDGFINGWCDCEQNLTNSNITVNSMMSQRHQEHVRTFGNSPCEWAFDDGYREGFEGRSRCAKPPQQPAAPPTTTTNPPAPAPATTPAAPQQPPVTNPAPAPTQPANCPPATNPAPTQPNPTPAPPTNTQPPPTSAPTQPANCPPGTNTTQPTPTTTAPPAKPAVPPTTNPAPAPPTTTTPATSSTCHTTPAAPPPASQPANNHCHTPAADLPADHQCSSGCDHGNKKEGLIHKLEHALHIK